MSSDATKSDLPPGLGRPAEAALTAAGFTRLQQLTTVTKQDLLALHGVGPKAVRILDAALADHGLGFASPTP